MNAMRFAHKIMTISAVCLTIAAPFGRPLYAQQLRIVEKYRTYCQDVQADSLQKMVELKTLLPNIVYDLRYATAQNFTGRRLYRQGDRTFLRLSVARALRQVQAECNRSGWGLKVFDAYRPYRVTRRMWDLIHDERYVADPAKGSGHNRGLAVDLTLIDLATGKELDMGTGFDNFTDSAHHSFTSLSATVIDHRKWLRTVMERYGFRALETEWWHYSWPNDRNYAVLDLDFKTLGKRD